MKENTPQETAEVQATDNQTNQLSERKSTKPQTTQKSKKDRDILDIIIPIIIIAPIIYFTWIAFATPSYHEEQENYENLISENISEGNYAKAYSIIDSESNYVANSEEKNEIILKNEIASLISESDGASALPKIVFAIKDRASKNVNTRYSSWKTYHGVKIDSEELKNFYGPDYLEKWAESDMFDYAIDMANAVDNEDLVAKLKKSKPEFVKKDKSDAD